MTRRVLLVSERGAHPDHAERLLAFAHWFSGQGWQPFVALRELRAVAREDLASFPLLQAPVWPADLSIALWTSDVKPTLAGFLFESGAARIDILRNTVAAARGLLDLVGPDLIVADQAPAVMLAASGRCPVISTGWGSPLPADPSEDSEQAAELARWIAETAGLTETPETLSGLFAGQATLRTAHPLLAGGAGDCLPVGARALPFCQPSGKLHFDLTTLAAQNDVLMAAIIRYPGARSVWSPGLPAAVGQALQNAKAEVLTAPPDPSFYQGVAGVVHAGGPALATRLAMAGLPQLILHREPVMAHIAGVIETAEAGKGLSFGFVTLPDVMAALHEIAAPDRPRGEAMTFGDEMRRAALPDWPEALAVRVSHLAPVGSG